jgi:hypothetical protein
MFVYSDDGQHFLGYRVNAFGKLQVIYDYEGKKHQVYDILTPNVPAALISVAIKKAVNHKMVVPALFSALSAQNINLEKSS